MKKKIFNWLYKLALKIIAINLVKHETRLTRDYLIERGWVEIEGHYLEEGIKLRDTIWIKFSGATYMVFHGNNKTYIATERSVQWFENYYMLMHPDNGRYTLAGI